MYKKLDKLAVLGILALLLLGAGVAQAEDCTATVTAPASIQVGIDSNPGGVVCLSGPFHQSVVFGPEDSGTTLRAADGATAVLDGTAPADSGTTLSVDAIRFLDDTHDVTIEGLEIKNYTSGVCCGQGNAIQAWAVNTNNITVRKNNMHDNTWNGVLVGSEGAQTHTGWAVHDNMATGNGFAQIELTNCSGCSAHGNTVSGTIGILVQARNTNPNSGTVEIQGVSVKNNQITSDVGGYKVGVYALGLASDFDFNPISGAQGNLKAVSVTGNQITAGRRGILAWGFSGYDGSGAGHVINASLVRNTITCSVLTGSRGISLSSSDVINTKVVNNTFSGCETNLKNLGEDTKVPPGHPVP